MPDKTPVCPIGYRIRARTPEDDSHLVAAENAANRLLAGHGYPALAEDGFPDVDAFRHLIGDGTVFAAVDAAGIPVGYAVARPLGEHSHLRELAVHPNHGRRGLGRALVGTVIDAAGKAGFAGVSLSTFRDVPFNRPFYRSMGFGELPLAEATPVLADAFRREVPAGVDPATRLLMIRRT